MLGSESSVSALSAETRFRHMEDEECSQRRSSPMIIAGLEAERPCNDDDDDDDDDDGMRNEDLNYMDDAVDAHTCTSHANYANVKVSTRRDSEFTNATHQESEQDRCMEDSRGYDVEDFRNSVSRLSVQQS
jgi:hypothetical protein